MTVGQLVAKLNKLDQNARIFVKNNYDVDPNDSRVLDVEYDDGVALIKIDNSTMLFDINVFGMYNWKSQLLEKQRYDIAQLLKSENLTKQQLVDGVVDALSIKKIDPMKYLPEFA